jgi:hypothetical protein
MRHNVSCSELLEEYTIRWRIKEHFPDTVAELRHSSRPGQWHGEWDWVEHPFSYTPWLWMDEDLPGDTEGVIRLRVRVIWRDAATVRVLDRGAFRDSVTLTGTCGDDNPSPSPTASPSPACHPSYPDFCIPPPPPDLNCDDVHQSNFTVLPPDPHDFDGDNDGVGCES